VQRDADNRGPEIRYPRLRVSELPAWSAQECAIATVHQSEACLDKPNGAIAQIVSLPGAFWNVPRSEQHDGDFAISSALHAAVDCAESKHDPLSALGRQLVQGRTRRAPA
jgi:hypothetical protein